jgi:tRNA nucleotidyltransferase/poly(A) polymerase
VRVEVDLWQLLGVAFALGSATLAGFWAMAKIIAAQSKQQIDGQFEQVKTQFKEVSGHLKTQDEHTRRLERELLEFRAELPRDYVRREDYVQAVASLHTKIDSVWLRMENMFNKYAVRGRE